MLMQSLFPMDRVVTLSMKYLSVSTLVRASEDACTVHEGGFISICLYDCTYFCCCPKAITNMSVSHTTALSDMFLPLKRVWSC